MGILVRWDQSNQQRAKIDNEKNFGLRPKSAERAFSGYWVSRLVILAAMLVVLLVWAVIRGLS